LYNKIDFEKTWLNIISSTFIERAKIPLIMPTDKTAIQLALATCWATPAAAARMVLIKNTGSLERFFISRPLAAEARQVDRLHGAERFAPLSFSARQTLESCF
jgi:hypothetical protein